MGDDGCAGAIMRTTFGKIVRRAGMEPWPRPLKTIPPAPAKLGQVFPVIELLRMAVALPAQMPSPELLLIVLLETVVFGAWLAGETLLIPPPSPVGFRLPVMRQ
jgi:hypothetical protein